MSLPVISIAQMREWEKASWAAGKSEAEVIRRVGKIVAQYAMQLTRPGDAILILAGKGHNGDDARCVREHLKERNVAVFDIKDAEADFPQLNTLLASRPALVVDGLFGIGINRPLDAAWIKFVGHINAARLPVLAIDVPSGLNADSGEAQGAAIEASVTLTVGAPKAGLLKQNAWPYVGRLEIAKDVGLIACPHQSELNWTLPEDFRGFPPPRPVAGHKGTFGHLAIIAGSIGYHGAAVLAARAVQRAQPGLITLFTHEPAYFPIAAQLQSVMVQAWTPDLKLPGDFSAVLIGPGLASPDVPEELKRSVRRLWRDSLVPLIVDASALDWVVQDPFPKNAVRVLTPHPGEAGRLLKSTAARVQANRTESLRELSRRFGNTWVVLKGHQSLIGRSEGEIFVNSSGNPFLGQGGSGDALSGYLAGLLAQPALQADAARTIRFAVWQHGAAADLLSRTQPNWIVENLVETLGLAKPN
jgi:ADP-dependent NAD(P)H-hydrate dehydratase / NAD(P)H-hydrate epimerase